MIPKLDTGHDTSSPSIERECSSSKYSTKESGGNYRDLYRFGRSNHTNMLSTINSGR